MLHNVTYIYIYIQWDAHSFLSSPSLIVAVTISCVGLWAARQEFLEGRSGAQIVQSAPRTLPQNRVLKHRKYMEQTGKYIRHTGNRWNIWNICGTGVGIDALFWGGFCFHQQNKYLLEIRSQIVGWCETLGHLPTPVDGFIECRLKRVD